MKNLWNETEAAQIGNDLLKQRVYTSRLLGREPALVLHGGGNTSVKAREKNLFGDTEEILYVKGSGWDLATIADKGFSPVRMEALLRMAYLEKLTDADMVRAQKSAMTNPDAPAPSVEAILHAIIPYTFVDHTHADAVVAISNTPDGENLIRKIYGNRVLYVPYVMPGFILARKVYELTRDVDWNQYEGMILLHHGIFSFANDARTSYDRMIQLVSLAEDYLQSKNAWSVSNRPQAPQALSNLLSFAHLRKEVSKKMGSPTVMRLNASPEALSFAELENVSQIACRGPLTPDHVLHTKRLPLLLSRNLSNEDISKRVEDYAQAYQSYFSRHGNESLRSLDVAPRWAVWPGQGILSFGLSPKRAEIVSDITRHTIRAIQWAEGLGGWVALSEKDIFEVEYWDLEQAKLKKGGAPLALQGKTALVTGAASGIGKSCVESLRAQGAAVVALDIHPRVMELWQGSDVKGVVCDVTQRSEIDSAIEQAIRSFGGIDIVIANAGIFPESQKIESLDDAVWDKTLCVNLTSQMYLFRACAPYLALGIDPAIVVIASKNVLAPGPGAAAYSASKAGMTQLARVAALELGSKGVKVNLLHPHAVMDTNLWTPEVLASRAKHYNMSVEEYKRNNLLKVEVVSQDVADLACAMAGPLFSKITGAQIAIDGGSDRII